MQLTLITNDGHGPSRFEDRDVALDGALVRRLSAPMATQDVRLRESHGYASSFHCAEEPTLIIVLSGHIRITLPSSDTRDFTPGMFYVAQDYLADGITHQEGVHGHLATQIGDTPYRAAHVRLVERV